MEKELPAGWFFNYCNVFAGPPPKVSSLQLRSPKTPSNPGTNPKNPKGSKSPNPNNQNAGGKKGWDTPTFTKLAKRYEEYSAKPPE